jgi:CubicO group peptidase (beta-lactamase class C family)
VKHSLIKRKLARVDRALDKAIDSAEIPGAVVFARMPRGGERLEHWSVRGNAVVRPERLPMRADTIFDLASLTKPLATATALMVLVDDGRVGLDDPVTKVLPRFGDRGKDGVTLRHLLAHSAGLKPWRPFYEALAERERKSGDKVLCSAAAKEAVIERICLSAPVHEIGEAAVYGDLDFIVLGAVVEAVADQPLDRFCEERIFSPLGLRDTHFIPLGDGAPAFPEESRRRTAATENCPWRNRILWGEVHDGNAWAMGGVAGHAGLFSTARDVMDDAQALLEVWHGRSEVLPRAALRSFFARQEVPGGTSWALGWDTPTPGTSMSGKHFSANSVGHLGFTGTSLWIDLESEAIVVMLTNRVHLVEKRSPFKLRPEVHDLILESFRAD